MMGCDGSEWNDLVSNEFKNFFYDKGALHLNCSVSIYRCRFYVDWCAEFIIPMDKRYHEEQAETVCDSKHMP